MGTRHEITIICDGQVKARQYGQWDGYPTGQGKGIADFVQKNLLTKEGVNKFIKAVRKCEPLTDKEAEDIERSCESPGGWTKTHPWLSRDCGSDLLDYILKGKARKLYLSDHEENLKWCEYFYKIDLDSGTIQKSRTGKGGKKYTFEQWTPKLMERLK